MPAKKHKKKRPPRRPFDKFGPTKRAQYLQLLREGNHRSTSARAVGVSHELVRLFKHSEQGKDFEDLEVDAEQEACGLVEDALYQAALSGNVVACQVWLYNRSPGRWMDKRNIEHSGPGGGPLQHEHRYDAQLQMTWVQIEAELQAGRLPDAALLERLAAPTSNGAPQLPEGNGQT